MNARLEELRSKFQENPRRYFAPYANELRKAGDVAQAISVCRSHIATQPGHVSGHIVLGQALYEAGDALEARDVFGAALELDPENLIALRTLGEIAQVRGEFGAARQWYERLLDADPRNSDVVQLLRDLPAAREEPAPPLAAHVAEINLLDHSVDVLPPSAPKFHTNFTGAVPAYQPEETPEPAREEPSADFVDVQSAPYEAFTVEPTSGHDLVSAAPEMQSSDPLDVVDLDAFAAAMGTESASDVAPPDESYSAGSHEPLPFDEMGFDLPTPEVKAASAEHVTEAETRLEADAYEVDLREQASEEFTTASADDGQPRALFAERGFDGPANDQIGWVTTPSVQESDPEAAPEHWLDEPAASAVEEVAEVTAQSPPDVQPVAEAGDLASDSWFKNHEKAPVAQSQTDPEPLLVSHPEDSDDFWLPPDLSQPAPEPDDASEGFSELAEPALEESTPGAEFPVISEARNEWEPVEPDRIEVEAVSAPPTPESVSETHHTEAASETHDADAESEPHHAEAAFNDYRDEAAWEDSHVDATPDVQAEVPLASTWSEPFSTPVVDAQDSTEQFVSADASTTESDYAAADALPIITPPHAEPVVGHTPALSEASTAATQMPFVTETLAELYLQQGFRDEALAIYRQLADRDPSDQTLRLRIAAIEQGSVSEPVPAASGSDESHVSSQSVRTFFARFARRAAVSAPQTTVQPSESAGTPDVPFVSAASALANLFAASKPPASDEGAASTLANAFTDPAGRPSRAADRELSLDHLFRDVPAGGSPRGGVSLDEFYSTPNASAGSPTELGEADESAESGGTDIRQFTAWLEGLRKK